MIVGTWFIDYDETGTKTEITFNQDGTFFQKGGNYYGNWNHSNSVLTLNFNSLVISGEPGPLTLSAKLDDGNETFSGMKSSSAYKGGVLHYNARKLSSNDPNYDSDSPCQIRRGSRSRQKRR